MPEMNEMELRTLFKVAGPEKAPIGLHAAVMDQVLAQKPITVVEPLISHRHWIMAALFLSTATVLAWILSLYLQGDPSSRFTLPLQVDLSSAEHFLHHATWIAATMGLAFVLTLMDRALARVHTHSIH